MTDFMSSADRSSLMSRIRGKNTRIERLMFDALKRRGVRFSTHLDGLEGHPDIAIRKWRLLVFLDGDFWHGRNFELWHHKLTPSWAAKIERNVQRDRRQRAKLRRQGWHVIRLWGSEILKNSEKCADRVLSRLTKIIEKASTEDGSSQKR